MLLFGGAYLALLPWVNCAFSLGGRWNADLARICTFGAGMPGFGEPLWRNLVATAIYVAAAVWIALTRRIDFGVSAPERS